jgi:hypothetical protein
MPASIQFPMNLHKYGLDLILRRSTRSDADRLAEFNVSIHGDPKNVMEQKGIVDWTKDLLSGTHPTHNPDDFMIVENIRTKEVVSTMNLISQTWTYAGIPFGVGRPELVGTVPTYRNRGLIRLQFDIIHELSHQRGHLVQGITGIPYYYRQFGYEMALTLGGQRRGYSPHVPPPAAQDNYRIRPAVENDSSFILKLYTASSKRWLVSSSFDETLMRYELTGKLHYNLNRLGLYIIETLNNEPIGYIGVPPVLWGTAIVGGLFEVLPGCSWYEITPLVLRTIWELGQAHAKNEGKTCDTFGLQLGPDHPAYQAAGDRLPALAKPYAWYIRVADLPAFIRKIAPVLEQRLETSLCAGLISELKISFYRQGIRLAFEQGKLTTLEAWKPVPKEGDAGFPDLTFLQLLFGYRSLEELRYAFPDCWANDRASMVLSVLFPKHNSWVWGIS